MYFRGTDHFYCSTSNLHNIGIYLAFLYQNGRKCSSEEKQTQMKPRFSSNEFHPMPNYLGYNLQAWKCIMMNWWLVKDH